MEKTKKLVKKITIPLIIIGVLLSTLHQSSLGSLYLIVPDKLHGLWYSPYLPVFFYVSAICVGCAMIIFESFMSSRAFNRGLEHNLLTEIARVAVMMLGVFMVMTVVDLADRKALPLLFQPRTETYFFWGEKLVGVIIPFILLAQKKIRENQNWLFWSAAMIIIGFVLNRLNISITGMEGWAGKAYFPSWMEISVTLSIVAAGFVIFALAAKYLPLFKHEHQEHRFAPQSEWVEDLRNVSQLN
jgi:Ni/Fe-hydrogenase subunit HybB-like protein